MLPGETTWFVGQRQPNRPAVLSRALVCAWLVLPVALVGCAGKQGVALRKVPNSPLIERLQLTNYRGPQPSDRTLLLLRRQDLQRDIPGDPQVLLTKLEELMAHEPTPEGLYSTAEIAFLAGRLYERQAHERALDLYATSVAYAYRYLFDERCTFVRNAFDPQFRGACDLYNGALESALRLWKKSYDTLSPGVELTMQHGAGALRVRVEACCLDWHAEDFGHFEFVSDYDVDGLTNRYQTYGLGVPLIVERRPHEEPGSLERHYPPKLTFPITALVRVEPNAPASGSDPPRHECVLELHDPLAHTDVPWAGGRVPLESDLSTPLAYFLGRAELGDAAKLGLLDPEQGQSLRGLYMIQPYDPRKIPVVMVHGLASSPITWMEMFNDLRSERQIRDRFQFWFYMYPTGQPFWVSAAQFREDLARLRSEVDPAGRLPAFDHMVLVGHSMGGLVSKLQVLDSGDRVWRTVSDQPFQVVQASLETKTAVERQFFFHPNPAVTRVVTIGTPHRGSRFANTLTRWVGDHLIRIPAMQMLERNELVRDNPGAIRDRRLLEIRTSIDSLSPDCPIFPVLLEAPRPPQVRLHNIVGVVEDSRLLRQVSGVGDGVVELTSAHLDDAASEIVVNADHVSVHRHPRAVLEVRRVLLEHLRELASPPATTPGYLRTCEAPAS